jgi:3,2-trans-enoyl-CoA isomerase
MNHVDLTRAGKIAVLTLHRGKVNAFNDSMVEEFQARLDELATDDSARGLVITGHGGFFSFGLDVPDLYPLPKEVFAEFLRAFTHLYAGIYVYPKPVVAALNGHAIAGGCMVVAACDRRLMAEGRAKIGLNEITFGSTVFAGSTEILRACVGQRNAEEILLTGGMFEPGRALTLGLVDRLVAPDDLLPMAVEEAQALASGDMAAFVSMRKLLRGQISETIRSRESDSIREFVDIWYSESTREHLRKIEIRK